MMRAKAFPGRVIFDHLPKTAGQAVNTWLRETLGDGCVTENLSGNQRELIQQFGGAYSVISGHVAFEGEGLDPRYDYVTLFRHPLDRAISWIYFVLENHGDQDIIKLRADVRAFLASQGEAGALLMERYVDHLCSVHAFSSPDPQKRIDHALSVLDEYAFWGLYERLPEFISDFAAFLQVPAPNQLRPVNVTVRRPRVDEIAPALRARLEEINALDIAFYESLQLRYSKARRRWQRPQVAVSNWQPLCATPRRRFCHPDFALLAFRREGGSNVDQHAILTFRLEFSLARPVENLECGIHIRDEQDALAFSTNSNLAHTPIGPLPAGMHQVSFCLVAALPQGQYRVGFSFAEITPQGRQDLGHFDAVTNLLIQVARQVPSEGYVSLPVAMSHRTMNDRIVRLPQDGRGYLEWLAPVVEVVVGQSWQQPVRVFNHSAEDWVSTLLNPLNLSYHWLDAERKVVVFDGVRTPIPNGRLEAGASVEALLTIGVPDTPGVYRLQALPVLESYAWFDALGFTPGEIEVRVISTDAPRPSSGKNDFCLES